MIVKNVIPLTVRKKERDLWYNSDYDAKVLIDDHNSDFKKTLESFLIYMLINTGVTVSIAWASDIFTVNTANTIFTNSYIYKKFVLKGDFIVKSGAIITRVNTSQELTNLIEYWGILDSIQIVFTSKDSEEDVIRIICDDNYIYNRKNFKELDAVMKYSRIIINDTGDGDEFELIFHKKDNLIINELIKKIIV